MSIRPDRTRGHLLGAIQRASWVLLVFGLFAVVLAPVDTDTRLALFVLLGTIGAYLLLFFHWLYPRYEDRFWVDYVPPIMNIVLVGAFDYIIGNLVNVDIVFIVIVVNTAIRLGRRFALFIGMLSAVTIIGVDLMRAAPIDLTMWLSTGLVIVVFLVAAYLAGSQADVIRRQAREAGLQNQNLNLLLEASAAASASLELKVTLPQLAEKIARGLPVTVCRVCLLDRSRQSLVDMGVFPLRPLPGGLREPGQKWRLEDLPAHRRALESGQPLVLRQSDPAAAMGRDERVALLFDEYKSACLVPLIFEGQALGIISLGEARSPEREPFDQPKLGLLHAIAAQAASLINNAQLHQAVRRNAERVAVLNQVGEAIGSTIEMDGLLEMIRKQLSHIIPTDTYYVGLHEPGAEFVDLKIVFDDGQSYPPERIPYGAGFTGRVIESREPLLLGRLSAELTEHQAQATVVGNQRVSESWLGVPLLMTDGFTGILAVASYQPDMFDEDDLALLTNVASQVALALDNARHHAQVQEQARLDSLTGVYNHGHVLNRLEEELKHGKAKVTPVSLIMLDIDYFKNYNDTYGHVVGDEVLRLVVHVIRRNLKSTDAVGRWGGEEFAIVLPHATTEQALGVAGRIRESLTVLPILISQRSPTRPAAMRTARVADSLASLTVSQGIATCPKHAASAEELVDRADQALYKAKARGRDQTQEA